MENEICPISSLPIQIQLSSPTTQISKSCYYARKTPESSMMYTAILIDLNTTRDTRSQRMNSSMPDIVMEVKMGEEKCGRQYTHVQDSNLLWIHDSAAA